MFHIEFKKWSTELFLLITIPTESLDWTFVFRQKNMIGFHYIKYSDICYGNTPFMIGNRLWALLLPVKVVVQSISIKRSRLEKHYLPGVSGTFHFWLGSLTFERQMTLPFISLLIEKTIPDFLIHSSTPWNSEHMNWANINSSDPQKTVRLRN